MNSGDFWQNIKEDWQSVSPTVDVARLRRQVDRKRRRMLAFQLLDMVAALILTGFVTLVGFPPAMHIGPVVPWLLLAFLWMAVIVSGWLRFSTWKTGDLDAAGLLRLGLRRAKGGMHFVWFNIFGLPVIFALYAPSFWQMWSTGNEAQKHHVLAGICANAVFYLLVIGWGVWYGRRQRRKIRRARYLLRQLEQENGGGL